MRGDCVVKVIIRVNPNNIDTFSIVKQVRRQIKRRWAYGNGWLCCRRDDRRRNARFGSVAQETNRTHVNNNSTSASSKGSVSVGISVGSMCSESGSEHKLLEEKQTLLLEGEKHLNGCKLNSNDSGSHGMNTIDELILYRTV